MEQNFGGKAWGGTSGKTLGARLRINTSGKLREKPCERKLESTSLSKISKATWRKTSGGEGWWIKWRRMVDKVKKDRG